MIPARSRPRSERSDAGDRIVPEVTGIGQLEFGSEFIFFSPSLRIKPAVGAVEMWESGALCRIPKRGGKLAFGVFQGASCPQRKGRIRRPRWVPARISARTKRSDAGVDPLRKAGSSLRRRNRGDATGRANELASFLGHPDAKFLCGKQRISTAAGKGPRQQRSIVSPSPPARRRWGAPPGAMIRTPSHCAFCASIHLSFRYGERCAPAGPGCYRPGWDRRSVRATE